MISNPLQGEQTAQLTLDSNSEIQRQIFKIAFIMLEENEALVKLRIERGKVVQEALLA